MRIRALTVLVAVTAIAAVMSATGTAGGSSNTNEKRLSKVDHIVVIYQENHSFDNLYGGWEGVNGRTEADSAHSVQVNQLGAPFQCLLQNDPNLTAPPLSALCNDTTVPAKPFASHFPNAPFNIDTFVPATAATCPNGAPGGSPGGCTRDLVHRFYQEQYQLDGGRQDRYVTGSDAAGLTMGYYDTQALPIYMYLHQEDHPHYAILDNFFQAAFGGSFLNHQYLIAAAAPVDADPADAGKHSILDTKGFPNATYPLYSPTRLPVRDSQLTQACGLPTTVPGLACGDFAVNTMQPSWQPKGGGAVLPPQTGKTIGDRLDGAGIDWAWYAGGWSNAAGLVGAPGWTNGNGPSCSDPASVANPAYPYCPSKLFQFHHHPFNYFAAFDPGTTAGRANRAAHLKDEAEFISAARSSTEHCNLKPVSFVKPLGPDNEHPGYASEANGSNHLVALLRAIESSSCAKDTMVIITYDEFGGQWDHVSPPGQGNNDGPHDLFGPGTRIPTLVLAPRLRGNEVVDSTSYDTTSILATIEHRWNLVPIGASSRDAQVNDLSSVFDAHQVTDASAGDG